MATSIQGCETIPEEKLQDWHLIGRGSFGDIYRARHEDWGHEVAVKKLNRHFSQGLDELFSEARKMTLALSNTHVIRLYGMYESLNAKGICHGIVMEYLEHGSLASLLFRVKPVPWALKIRILHEVSLGMNRLHALSPPLLHLDLKPSNVLLDAELHVRIADFGLSRFKRGASLAAGAEEYGGTLEYMPPEFLKDDVNYRPTQVFDVYSYAILMWAVLTGQEPYSEALPAQIKLRVPHGDRPDMTQLQDAGSVEKLQELKELMQRCWHQDPCRRPTFKECTAETEKVFSAHKCRIIPAVRKVQDILTKMVTSSQENPSTSQASFMTNKASCVSTSTSLATSGSNMSQLVKEFQTMQFMEEPSQNLEAVPISETGVSPAQPLPAAPESATAVPPAQPRPSTPQLATDPCTQQPHCDPRSLTSNWGPQQPWCVSGPSPPDHPSAGYPSYVPFPYSTGQYPPSLYYAHPQFPYSVSPTQFAATPPPIHISGKNISGIQIGNGNSMQVNYGGKRGDRKKSKK